MCVTDRHDMTLTIKEALNPIQATTLKIYQKKKSFGPGQPAWIAQADPDRIF